MHREQVLKEIIEGYRNIIYQRYQYQNIRNKYGIDESINEETVNLIRTYFLNFIYPEYDKRAELNEAFQSLDNYIKHPDKLLRILLDSLKLIFSYGRHLPKILNTGLKAIKSYRAATNFENKLVDEAIKNNINAPFNLEKINSLIKLLSRKEIDRFIQSSQLLFQILHDRKQVQKIKEILHHLIYIMHENQEVYSLNDVKGLELGLEMIKEGDAIFSSLTKENQLNLINLIMKIEIENLNTIF